MSLRFRIAVTIFALETLLVTVVLWTTLQHTMDGVRDQVAQTEEVTLHLLGDLSRVALLSDEYDELQSFIEQALDDPRIRTVVVSDIGGRVVAATNPRLIGLPLPRAVDAELRYWRVTEVFGHVSQLGVLAVEFSDGPLLRAHQDARNLGLTLGITGMVLIGVVGLAMGYVLTRRLESLALAADRVADDDLSVRFDAVGSDEVARVGRAFNNMVERLADGLNEIKRARDQLIQPTEAMSEGFALWDADDRLVLCNRPLRALFAMVGEHLHAGISFKALSSTVYDRALAHEADTPERAAWIAQRLAQHRRPSGYLELALNSGRWIGVSESRTPDGGVVGIYTDVTELKERQRALEFGERRLRAIMDSVFDGIITVDAGGRIESANPAALRVFAREDLVGVPVEEVIAHRRHDDVQPSGGGALDVARLPTMALLEMAGRRPGGATFLLEMSVTYVELEGRRTYILTVRDITARKAAEEMVLYHATHDRLTDLPNRTLFDDRLEAALKHAATDGEMVAVMFLDLDRFKNINDTLGHAIGDGLLVAVTRRLRASVREHDTVARMGGDEFIFILRAIRSSDDVIELSERILQAIRPPFHVDGHELHVTASIGCSLYPTDGRVAGQLLKSADTALYRAKERGRNRISLFTPTMSARAFEQLALENHLRRAVEQEQFNLVYQPQVALATGRVVGVEALVRWRHPDLGVIPPQRFVALAEESGLIHPLGMWVLRTACRQHRTWRQQGLGELRLAVNMSPRQFQEDGLAASVAAALDEAQMPATRLELELTEGVLMREGDSTARLLGGFSELGISLALDDFGTGYSSLSYLKRYPIRRVKIDRTFVRDITVSDGDAALSRAVIAMAHGLNVTVVAEGVETAAQLELLRRYACDEGQGYYLGPPVVGEDLPRLLMRRPPMTAVAPAALTA